MPYAHPSGFPPRTSRFTVARGPVPRDRCLHQSSVGQECLLLTRSGAGAPELQRSTPRSRHGEGQALALRKKNGDRGTARDRPSPYDKTTALSHGDGKRPRAARPGGLSYRAFNSPQRVVSLPRAPTCPFKRVVAKGKRIPPKDTSSSR